MNLFERIIERLICKLSRRHRRHARWAKRITRPTKEEMRRASEAKP